MLHDADRIRMQHMLEAAREAVAYANGRSRCDLDTDRQLMHSMVRCIEIIGEAANRVSANCQAAHPDLGWQDMIGMRNRLAHGYFDINLTIVWQTVVEELPALIQKLERVLASAGET